MRTTLLCFGLLVTVAIDGMAAAELTIAKITRPAAIPAALIIGRAVCSDSTWLLADSRHLIEVRNDGQVSVHELTGLAATDRPWGFACLSDGTLWTMAAFQTLVRIDRTGRLQERIDLQVARLALYAVGDRLLFQPGPSVPGMAALMTSPARRPYSVKSWAGLVIPRGGPADGSGRLAICGVSVNALVPCWFGPARQFAISDGTASRTVDVAPLRSMHVDREVPIRDVALTSATAYWLLAGGRDAERGRTTGVRLFRIHENPFQNLFVDLKPTARIILNAGATRCLLLTVDGGLMEVVVTP